MPYITEERRMIQEQAREFTLNEVLPVANKLDPEKGDIPMSLRRKMAELGYFGMLIPEKYGGLGLGLSRVARWLRRAGGSLRWRAAPGGGTIFHLTLPLVEATSAPPAGGNGSLAGPHPPTLREAMPPVQAIS